MVCLSVGMKLVDRIIIFEYSLALSHIVFLIHFMWGEAMRGGEIIDDQVVMKKVLDHVLFIYYGQLTLDQTYIIVDYPSRQEKRKEKIDLVC